MRGGLQEHDEIIKEASKLQISSLRREIEQLQKGAEDRKGKLQQVSEISLIVYVIHPISSSKGGPTSIAPVRGHTFGDSLRSGRRC
ncbi:unnamed protein product [Gongylonema pulchrum]|uniref:Uncharacterized protein n=1 Tax=Gongylonema pulchrum TaxID=637853 RepID=A0A183ER21_9BILA|nr:unnamed protein product [Gongylonema pulchrum]